MATAVDAGALERELCDDAAQIHALMVRSASKAAALDHCGGWRGEGLRSWSDWIVVHTGFDRRAHELTAERTRATTARAT